MKKEGKSKTFGAEFSKKNVFLGVCTETLVKGYLNVKTTEKVFFWEQRDHSKSKTLDQSSSAY